MEKNLLKNWGTQPKSGRLNTVLILRITEDIFGTKFAFLLKFFLEGALIIYDSRNWQGETYCNFATFYKHFLIFFFSVLERTL